MAACPIPANGSHAPDSDAAKSDVTRRYDVEISGIAKAFRPRFKAAFGQRQHAHEQPSSALTERTRQRAIAGNRRLQLAFQPTFQLVEVGKRERFDIERSCVIKLAFTSRPQRQIVLSFNGG